MRKVVIGLVGVLAVASIVWYVANERDMSYTDIEPGFGEPMPAEPMSTSDSVEFEEAILDALSPFELPIGPGRYSGWSQYWRDFSPAEEVFYGRWQRPPGPTRVGLQAGQWQLADVPEELEGLRASSGAYGGGYSE